jgi:hypothetical protein
VIVHRIRQFARAGARPTEADFELARSILGEGPLSELFERQHPRDIVHSADTARWLLERGHEGRELLIAALLHDVGKGQQRRLDRTAYVILDVGGLTGAAADGSSRLEIRRALARTRRHSATGADVLLAAGAPAAAVELTRRHHDSGFPDPVLALLQQADAAS